MSNLELAGEKLKAARIILGTIDHYLETCTRLQGEVRKLSDEAERLLKGDGDGSSEGNSGDNDTDRGAASPA